MEISKGIHCPETIDISLTGRCQLDCAWCWGEEHTVGTVHGASKWMEMLCKFRRIGTSAVVFTGGEPLTSPALPHVLRFAKERLSMRTTLSTNAILLRRLHRDVLPWVDDLGLPLDGSTPEMNKLMRAGRVDNFERVLNAIKLAEASYPNIAITVRTVIARQNIHDVVRVPQMLARTGVDLSRIRHKLYQVEPIGPRATIIDTDEWRVDENDCVAVQAAIARNHPELSVSLQLYRGTSGRYYQIGPRGNAYGTLIDKEGKPQAIELGNPIEDFDQALSLISSQYSFMLTH